MVDCGTNLAPQKGTECVTRSMSARGFYWGDHSITVEARDSDNNKGRYTEKVVRKLGNLQYLSLSDGNRVLEYNLKFTN